MFMRIQRRHLTLALHLCHLAPASPLLRCSSTLLLASLLHRERLSHVKIFSRDHGNVGDKVFYMGFKKLSLINPLKNPPWRERSEYPKIPRYYDAERAESSESSEDARGTVRATSSNLTRLKCRNRTPSASCRAHSSLPRLSTTPSKPIR